jgi:peptidoglycan/LPS O-acetylase OafA/YrhL
VDGQSVAVEAWRGVAAWMVVYTHFWAFSGTDWAPLRLTHTGVNLFFVVSGFVFAPYLFGRRLHWQAHAVRRLFRLYPAYLLALALYAGLKAAEGQPLRYVAEHLTFLHVQSKEMAFYFNPPFWSLPAEVEFYLLLPLLAGAARQAAYFWGPQGPVRLVLLMFFGATALRCALGWNTDAQGVNAAFIVMHHLPGLMVEFLLGALAWRASTCSLLKFQRLGLAALGLAGWWGLAAWYGQVGDAGVYNGAMRGLLGATAAVCFALLVAGTVRPKAPLAPAATGAAWRWPALWAGRLSYGVYLFHMAALRLAEGWAADWGWSHGATRSLAVALTLAMATAVYLAWENPWRLFGRRWAARLSR